MWSSSAHSIHSQWHYPPPEMGYCPLDHRRASLIHFPISRLSPLHFILLKHHLTSLQEILIFHFTHLLKAFNASNQHSIPVGLLVSPGMHFPSFSLYQNCTCSSRLSSNPTSSIKVLPSCPAHKDLSLNFPVYFLSRHSCALKCSLSSLILFIHLYIDMPNRYIDTHVHTHTHFFLM